MAIIHDFFYMWRGKETKPLLSSEQYLLDPITIKKGLTAESRDIAASMDPAAKPRDVGQLDFRKSLKKTGSNQRALLLLHGFSSSPAVFRALLPKLTTYDAIVCPVLPGHGESIAAFAQVTSLEWVQAAEHACEALLRDYDEVDVLGLSLGGLLACHLGRRFNLHHIYLLAPALRLRINIPIILWLTRMLHKFGCRYIPNRAGNLYMHLHDELTYRKLPLTTIIELLTFIQQSNKKDDIDLQVPTDLFLGRHDEVVDSSQVSALIAHNPQVITHWLENSAHVLPLDGDIDAIAKCLNDYNACIPA